MPVGTLANMLCIYVAIRLLYVSTLLESSRSLQCFVSHWKIPHWAFGGPDFSEGQSTCFYSSQGIPIVPINRPSWFGHLGRGENVMVIYKATAAEFPWCRTKGLGHLVQVLGSTHSFWPMKTGWIFHPSSKTLLSPNCEFIKKEAARNSRNLYLYTSRVFCLHWPWNVYCYIVGLCVP